jgi:predicted dehydrogenase
MMRLRWMPPDDWTTALPQTGRYFQVYDPSWTGIAYNNRSLGYLGEVAHFAQRCLGKVEGGPDLWDSYKSLLIGEAVYRSAEEGRTVDVC